MSANEQNKPIIGVTVAKINSFKLPLFNYKIGLCLN
jgi:hypothetical protein